MSEFISVHDALESGSLFVCLCARRKQLDNRP